MSEVTLLLVEDDQDLREILAETLAGAGYRTLSCSSGSEALSILEQRHDEIALVLSDVQMGPVDGLDLMRTLHARQLSVPVILMSAYATIDKAVEAMRQGAADYLVKPFAAESVLTAVAKHIPRAWADQADAGMISEADISRSLRAVAERVASSEATVMICGESGVGKEVLARFIHQHSLRVDGPFVAINCAAIPENMLEATLFGYEKGAFTGAYHACPGKFEQAQGGTLLLDEISEMDISLQAKLLRVLQEREVERLGGRKLIQLDIRVLATTNRNLRDAVAAGQFREDLYYRLNVFPLHLPPLRERREDILPLCQRFLQKSLARGEGVIELTDAARAKLLDHDWPGNIRELENVIERAMILRQGSMIDVIDLQLDGMTFEQTNVEKRPVTVSGPDLRSQEQALILKTLASVNGNRKRAAETLGISQRTLRYKLARMRDEGVQIPGMIDASVA